MNATQVLEAAVQLIESKSIRAWALSEHNRPLWTRYVEALVQKDGRWPRERLLQLSTYITVTAMG